MPFNEDQPRDDHGRFASGGNNGKSAREMRAERNVRKLGREASQLDRFHMKTTEELRYIHRDASLAAKSLRGVGSGKSELKYLDEANDAASVLAHRESQRRERNRRALNRGIRRGSEYSDA